MLPDQYTPEAICHAMGIESFADPAWETQYDVVLRVLFKPSFDPEICVTVTVCDSEIEITTFALEDALFKQDYPCTLPRLSETVLISEIEFQNILNSHSQAIAETQQPGGLVVICDGMAIDCVCSRGRRFDRFQTAVGGNYVVAFVRQIIEIAWRSNSRAGVRNALNRCASYVGLGYPEEQEPECESVQRLRIGVFGTSDERRAYYRKLSERQQ